jgi:hypothetical protein
MDRTIAIFDWIFLSISSGGTTTDDPKPNKKKGSKTKSQNEYQLLYLESPNVGLSSEAVQARKDREAASAKTVREKIAPTHTTLKDVYRFLTQDHALYTAHKLVDRGHAAEGGNSKGASSMVKQSYGASARGGSKSSGGL